MSLDQGIEASIYRDTVNQQLPQPYLCMRSAVLGVWIPPFTHLEPERHTVKFEIFTHAVFQVS